MIDSRASEMAPRLDLARTPSGVSCLGLGWRVMISVSAGVSGWQRQCLKAKSNPFLTMLCWAESKSNSKLVEIEVMLVG